jgi:ABC-type amino acid transport system permease subunit
VVESLKGFKEMTDNTYILIFGFLNAFKTNLEVGIYALLGGILVALPLTWLRIRGGLIGLCSETFISLLRAFPVFVLMFVLLNLFSSALRDFTDNEPKAALILALCAYAAAVISDAAQDSWHRFRQSEIKEALLIIPNLLRIFTILVMSSSIGAAVGVLDAVAFTLRSSDQIQDPIDRILLVFLVTVFFMLFFISIRFVLNKVVDRVLSRHI